MKQISIIDDDEELVMLLTELLSREGWQVNHYLRLAEAEKGLVSQPVPLILLDVMLPDGNGLDACKRFRQRWPQLGIVMLTARGDPFDKVIGLEVGADDYLAKPFEPRELIARIRSYFRRLDTFSTPNTESLIQIGALVIQPLSRIATLNEQPLSLTSIEYKILYAFAQHAGQVLSRETISQLTQADNYRPQDRTVDVQIARLRKKLMEVDPLFDPIATVRGEGYVFRLLSSSNT
ncbi:response regulator transcription factor [Leeia sp. TBRC 13508]|uniref:Response regulator transcription factor n=1 Tax=Leeia speluncae TaxID=2884804 RepID=A0ABS8D9I9_9NEIS|nr:response regulator transcription factor [Leeia speluncae]MCB6184865.1 response regulator transcription factor [Leeia speluncae]